MRRLQAVDSGGQVAGLHYSFLGFPDDFARVATSGAECRAVGTPTGPSKSILQGEQNLHA